MEGKNGFVGKALSLVMDMDAMVGNQFEQGLGDLDTAARAETQRLQEGAPGSETGLREGGAPLAARP
jgi:hypothetical protein